MAKPFRSRALDLFKMATPYAAVLVGLVWMRNAWLTLLLYHGLILAGTQLHGSGERTRFWEGGSLKACLVVVLPALLIVPLLLLRQNWIFGGRDVLGPWLQERGLHGTNLAVFLLYFALVNPLLEERHWAPLRRESAHGWLRHTAFAGYHVLVLYTLLQPLGCGVAFAVLLAISWIWGITARRCRGSLVPLLSHALADMAIAVGVYLIVC